METLKFAADAQLASRMDPVIDRAIAQAQIVGAVMLVARRGTLVYQRAAGAADREAQRAMTADAIFRYSSLTKLIVSATALTLIESGRLGLEDPVTKWLPEFRPRLPDGREPLITTRHLLTHTAGLSYKFSEPEDGPYHRANVSDGMDQPGLGFDENLRRLASVPLLFPPGTAWNYSLATDVLGKVIERASGVALQEMVARTITEPLKMHDTAFAARDPARLAVPYASATPQPVRMGDPHGVPFPPGAILYSPSRILDARSYPSGGTGMAGTAGDFLTFLEALRRGGEGLLRPTTIRMMTSNAIGDLPMLMGPGWGFGLAAAVLKDPVAANVPQGAGTWRWGGVYGHHWFVDPKHELSVVVLTNTALVGMIGEFPDALSRALYAAVTL
jgi:CubicO group peptidase (beta-lactamase class C family)